MAGNMGAVRCGTGKAARSYLLIYRFGILKSQSADTLRPPKPHLLIHSPLTKHSNARTSLSGYSSKPPQQPWLSLQTLTTVEQGCQPLFSLSIARRGLKTLDLSPQYALVLSTGADSVKWSRLTPSTQECADVVSKSRDTERQPLQSVL